MSGNFLTLGEKIRTYRLRANLNQSDLADKVGVHLNTISKWERDETTEEMPISSLRKLAEALEVSVYDLLKNEAA